MTMNLLNKLMIQLNICKNKIKKFNNLSLKKLKVNYLLKTKK